MNEQQVQNLLPPDPLAEMIQLVLQDQAQVDEMLQAIEAKEEELQATRQHFNSVLSAEPLHVREYCRDAVQMVDMQIDDFLQVLKDMKTYGETFDRDALEGQFRIMAEVMQNMTLSFLRFRTEALAARGPSSHSGLNTIINTIRRIHGGENIPDILQQDVFMEQNLAAMAGQSLDGFERNFFTEGTKAFYREYRNILGRFDQYFESQNPELLKELESNLEELGQNYTSIDVNHMTKTRSGGPTEIPAVNLVINTGNDYVQGTCTREVLQYFTEELWNLVNMTRARYDELAEKIAGNPDIKIENESEEEAEKIGDSLGTLVKALESLEGFLNSDDASLLKNAEELFMTGAKEFASALEKLKVLAEESVLVVCFRCGYKNAPGNMVCGQCKTLLPQVEQASTTTFDAVVDEKGSMVAPTGDTEPQITTHIHELFETASSFSRGEVSSEDFEKILVKMEERLENAAKADKEVPSLTPEVIREMGETKACEVHDILTDASSHYKLGLDAMRTGLKLYREFLSTPDPQISEEAEKTIWESASSLQQSQKLLESVMQV